MKPIQGCYAVITGAGKGLGLAFAEELASRGFNLILVALPQDNLAGLSAQIASKFKVDVQYYEVDLTQTSQIQDLARWIEEKYKIYILINNAGFGGSGQFDTADLTGLDTMILLNVRATTWMMHKLIPLLKKQPESYILNVSSMASFSPFAYKAVYSASKVYVEFIGKSLNKEFKKQGVHISTVHPGPMRTNAEVSNRIKAQSIIGRMGVEDPDYVAKTAIDRLFKKRSSIVIGKGNRLAWALMRALPRKLVMSLLSYGMRKEISRS